MTLRSPASRPSAPPSCTAWPRSWGGRGGDRPARPCRPPCPRPRPLIEAALAVRPLGSGLKDTREPAKLPLPCSRLSALLRPTATAHRDRPAVDHRPVPHPDAAGRPSARTAHHPAHPGTIRGRRRRRRRDAGRRL